MMSSSSSEPSVRARAQPTSATTSSSRDTQWPNQLQQKPTLKILGMKFVNSKVLYLLIFSRALSVLPSFLGMWNCFYEAYILQIQDYVGVRPITSVRSSELFMAGIWCIVCGYLSYAVVDGLMVRWIVTYSTPAAIVRMLSCSTLIWAMIHSLHSVLSPDRTYLLHIWIFIACILTGAYILQNFITSNLSLERRPRSVDLYKIAVFAVVPVGMASFITMIGLLRSLAILRLEVGGI